MKSSEIHLYTLYIRDLKVLFKKINASLQSFGVKSVTLMMPSHSSLNSLVRKSSGTSRTPDWIATSCMSSSVMGIPTCFKYKCH